MKRFAVTCCAKLLSMFLFSILLFGNAQVVAQPTSLASDFVFNQWTVNDGLPVNEISAIAQTQEGYMWLATFDGLVRFDGDQFVTFNSGNTSAFSTNRLASLLVDSDNNLWIVTESVGKEKALIKYRDGQFTAFGPKDGLIGNINVQLSPEGNLLVGTDKGAFFYDGKALKSFGDKLTGISVRSILNDSEGAYWFSTNEGAFRHKKNIWTQLTEKDGLNSRNIFAVHINPQGNLWIASETQLSLWEDGSITTRLDLPNPVNEFLVFHENPARPNEVLVVNNKRYTYIYKDNQLLPYHSLESQGVYRQNLIKSPAGTTWSHTRTSAFREGKLVYATGDHINDLFCDRLGNIWIAQGNGLIQLKSKLIKTVKNISVVYTLIEDQQGEIWAIQNLRDLFQLQGDSFQKVIGDIGGIGQLNYSLCAPSDGSVLIGTQNEVLRWDKKNPVQRLEPSNLIDPVPAIQGVKTIQEDAAGNLWLGSVNGLYQIDKKGIWHHFGKISDKKTLDVRIIYITQDGTLWIGTNGKGVLYFKNGKLNQLKSKQSLSGNIIRSIYEDNEGILWVGTEGWGLNRIERGNATGMQDAEITVYNKQNGLFDNMIHQILEDDAGRLWMSGNRGIFWVNRSELTALAKGKTSTIFSFPYDEKDGLPGREGNGGMQPAGFKSQKGELWFPMMGGVVHIDPAQVIIPTMNVLIEEINTSDSTWFIEGIEKKAFPLGQRDLNISFTALNFSTSSANIRYRYKLVDRDADWIEAGSQKEAIYNNLDPGTYTFKVMANNGGGWSVNQTSIEISIPYFFYETYWFYAIIILLIAAIVYGWVQWRVRSLKKKGKELEIRVELRTKELIIEKEETVRQKDIATDALTTIEKQAAALLEMDKMKSHFFTNVSHEFRTPLTLIIGPLEGHIAKLKGIPNGDTEDMEMALRNSKRLLRLVNQLLDVAKLESGHVQLNTQATDLRTVVESATDAFLSLAERNGTHLLVKLPDIAVMANIDTDLIEKALMNLVSNAFKFTAKNGVIKIQVVWNDGKITISVQDNGEGIHKDDQAHIFDRFHQVNESASDMQVGTGIGLSLARELVVLHGGSIELNSEQGLGSEFLIILPTALEQLEEIAQSSSEHYRTLEPLEAISAIRIKETAQPNIQNIDIKENSDQPILLIVEDNADIRTYVRKQFAIDYRIIEAENGQVGFQLAQEALPDLIISDVMMPVMDGYELCRRIKQHPDLDFIPVILLTAKAETSQKIEGLEIGADDYVVKPFNIDELGARVNNLIASRKKLKERLVVPETTPDAPDPLGWGNSPFANDARSLIAEHIGNENFSVPQLAELLQIGRTTLYSRVLELTGKTPTEAIKLSRIYQASALLKDGTGSISEVAYTTGFKSVSHFSKTFKEKHGITPSEYKRTAPESYIS